jgi:hypothetical protein
LLILEQGIVLCSKKRDLDDRSTLVSLHVVGAIVSQRLGFQVLAAEHKRAAETALNEEGTLKEGGFPILDEQDLATYASISIVTNPGTRY